MCHAKCEYLKIPQFSDTSKLCCNLSMQTNRPNLRVFHQEDPNGIANSEEPDQTAPRGAVRSGSTLFAQTYCPITKDHWDSFFRQH